MHDNLEPKLLNFKHCFKQCEHQKLTLLDKIAVIKYFHNLNLYGLLSVLLNQTNAYSAHVIKDMVNAIFEFLKKSKRESTVKLP